MNRRILLIDADPGFSQTLVGQLGRYAVEVVTEPDADAAIALATADPPALLIVGVDEPDKAGFKVFQRCRKAPLSKLPIMLVTSTVPPESFQKHKSLKTHADDYIDKRGLDGADLVARIDALIGLGAPSAIVGDDDLDIPVEVDEIALADGDMVLDEVMEEDVGDDGGGDFSAAPARPIESTHSQPTGTGGLGDIDSDIEDAFGGLLGDADVPESGAPIEMSHGEHVAPADLSTGIPQADDEDGSVVAAPVVADEAVPGMIHDGGLSAEPPDEPPRAVEPALQQINNLAELSLDEALEDAAPVPQAEPATPEPASLYESSPAISLDADELEVINDDFSPRGHDDATQHGGPPQAPPVDAAPAVPLIVEEPEAQTELAAAIEVEEMPVEVDADGDLPVEVEDEEMHLEVEEPAAEVEAPRAQRPSGMLNTVDLGLDALAEDADREQSGVYDRRALRKIGELERQIQQMKTELDRGRATAETAARPASREGEFLKLRENLLTGQKDLTKAKEDLGAKERELRDAMSKLDNELKARQAAQAKASELEAKAATDSSRAQAAEGREKEISAQLATLQQELAAKTSFGDTAEASRAQLEKDLANERALRASSASDAERALRVEREQMIARHQGELSALKAEQASQHEATLEALRAELTASAAAGATVAAETASTRLRDEHAAQLAKLAQDHAAALAKSEAARESAVDKLQAELASSTDSLQETHAAAVEKLVEDHDEELARLKAELARVSDHSTAHAAQLSDAQTALAARHQAELAERERAFASAQQAHADTIAELQEAHAATTAELQQGRDAALAEQRRTHEAALSSAQQAHADTIAELQQAHASAAAEQQQAEGAALADQKRTHDAIVAELQQARDTTLRDQRSALEAAIAQHAKALAEQTAAHESALADTKQAHEATVARLEADHEDALAAREAALAAASETHAAALARQQADAEAQLATLRAERDKAIAEARAELEAARTEAARTAAAHDTALAQAANDKAVALAEAANDLAAQLAQQEAAYTHARETSAAETTAALNELRAELERQAAAHGIKLDLAKREVDDLLARETAAKTELAEQHQGALVAAAAAHQEQLAQVETDKQRAIEEIQRASAEHRASIEKAAAQHAAELAAAKEAADREVAELHSALHTAKKTIEDEAARHAAALRAAEEAHATALNEKIAQHERALAIANGETVKVKAVADAEHGRAIAAKDAEHKAALAAKDAESAKAVGDVVLERDELKKGLSGARDAHKRTETELATAVQTIADRNAELRAHAQAIAERDTRLADLRKEIETLEAENTNYQEQVLRAYQKIKTDEAMVARAKKAMAIALTVLDEPPNGTKPDPA